MELEFLVHRRALGHAAVLADQFLERPETWSALRRLGSFLPIVSHGVGLSLGTAEGLDAAYVGRLAAFLEAIRPAWHGEHASFSRAGGRDLGHFAPLPRTKESVGVLGRNARTAARELPCPLILENVAAPLAWPGEVGEAGFHRAVAEASGCGLLLDLHNLHANAVNFDFDAEAELARFPLDAVVELHAAGGVERGGWLVDSHTRRPPKAVGRLLSLARSLGCAAPATLEWDEELPPFGELVAEVAGLRREAGPAIPPSGGCVSMPSGRGLTGLQDDFVREMLEGDGGAPDTRRAREGYARKRAAAARSRRGTS